MSNLAGTGVLVRLALRRDRVRLPIWVVATALLVYAQAASIVGLYPDPADLASAAELVAGNAAFIAMAGPPVALDTLGGRTAFEIAAFAMVLAALMSIFAVTRHGRAEEESGRAEMVRATVVGRHAGITAALIVAGLANVGVFVLCLLGLVAADLQIGGSVALALAIALVGFVFAGISAVTNQVTVSSRSASGYAGAVLGAAYVLRAAGDVGNGVLSWLSPIGWGQALRPYGGERWWVVALLVVGTIACVVGAYWLASHRDFGAGLVHPRPGPAQAAPSLLSPLGLAVRLHRGALIGWTAGLFLGGLAYGSIGGDVEDFVGDNETIADLIARGSGDLVDGFLGTASLILALIGTGFGIQAAIRPRTEEDAGRVEPLLSTATSRMAWLGAHLASAVVGTAVVLGAAGLGTGISFALTADDGGAVARQTLAALAYLPAATVLIGLVYLAFGALPRLVPVAWALLGVCFVVDFFGELLSLPAWVRNLSPFQHVPRLPAADWSTLPVVVLTLVAAALVVVGTTAFTRRDIATT